MASTKPRENNLCKQYLCWKWRPDIRCNDILNHFTSLARQTAKVWKPISSLVVSDAAARCVPSFITQTEVHICNFLQYCCFLQFWYIACWHLSVLRTRIICLTIKKCPSGALLRSHLFDSNLIQMTAEIWHTGRVVIILADDFPPSFQRASRSQPFVRPWIVLGGILVHTEYQCIFSLWYKFLTYRHTGVFDYTTFGTLRCATLFQTGPFSVLRF